MNAISHESEELPERLTSRHRVAGLSDVVDVGLLFAGAHAASGGDVSVSCASSQSMTALDWKREAFFPLSRIWRM